MIPVLLLLTFLPPATSRFSHLRHHLASSRPSSPPPDASPSLNLNSNGIKSVVIIGGGSAGIGAAQTLTAHGVTNITILEGNTHLGGRVHVNKLPASIIAAYPALSDVYFEQGANWIHGLSTDGVINTDHPLYPLYIAANMTDSLVMTDYNDYMAFDDVDGGDLTAAFGERLEVFGKAMGGAWQLASERTDDTFDISIGAGGQRFGWSSYEAVDRAVSWSVVDFEYAEDAKGCSLLHGDLPTYERLGTEDWFVASEGGFWGMFEKVLEGLESSPVVLTGKIATVVKHGEGGVEITVADGTTYSADAVVVATGMNTIKKQLLTFDPAMPEMQLEATVEMHLQSYVKVVAVYDPEVEGFWKDKMPCLQAFLVGGGDWPILIDFERLTGKRSFRSVLSSHLTGEDALRVLRRSDEDIERSWVAMTRRVFGEGVPEPVFFEVPRWEDNELQGGAYSNWGAGFSEEHFNLMGQAMSGGRVQFAGEHNSKDYSGFVHGGYLSGVAAANNVLQ